MPTVNARCGCGYFHSVKLNGTSTGGQVRRSSRSASPMGLPPDNTIVMNPANLGSGFAEEHRVSLETVAELTEQLGMREKELQTVIFALEQHERESVNPQELSNVREQLELQQQLARDRLSEIKMLQDELDQLRDEMRRFEDRHFINSNETNNTTATLQRELEVLRQDFEEQREVKDELKMKYETLYKQHQPLQLQLQLRDTQAMKENTILRRQVEELQIQLSEFDILQTDAQKLRASLVGTSEREEILKTELQLLKDATAEAEAKQLELSEAFDLVGPAQLVMQSQLSQMADASEAAHETLVVKDQEIVLLNKKLNEAFERITQLSGGANQPKLEIVSKRVEKEEISDALVKMAVDLSPWMQDSPARGSPSRMSHQQPDVESLTVAVSRCRRTAIKHERELESTKESLLNVMSVPHSDSDLYSLNELIEKLKEQQTKSNSLQTSLSKLSHNTNTSIIITQLRELLNAIQIKSGDLETTEGDLTAALQYIQTCPSASEISELKLITMGASEQQFTTEEVLKNVSKSLKLIRMKSSLPGQTISNVIEQVLSQTISRETEESLRTVVRLPHINSLDHVVSSAVSALKALRQKDSFKRSENHNIEEACHHLLSMCPSDSVLKSISEVSALPHNDVDYKLSVIVRTMEAIRNKENSSSDKDIEAIAEDLLLRVVSPDTLSEARGLLKQPRISAENATASVTRTLNDVITICECDPHNESIRRQSSVSPTGAITNKITDSISHRLISSDTLNTLKRLSCRDVESSELVSLDSLCSRLILILENIWSKFESLSGITETDVVMAANHLFNNCLIQDHVIPSIRSKVGAESERTTEECVQKLVENFIPEKSMKKLRDIAELPVDASFDKLVEEMSKIKMKKETVKRMMKAADTPEHVEFTNMDSLVDTVLLKIPSQEVLSNLKRSIPTGSKTTPNTIDDLISTALSNNDISVLTNDRMMLEEELTRAEGEVSKLRSELSDVSHLKQQLLVSPVKQKETELIDLQKQLEQSEARRYQSDAAHNATIDDLTRQLRASKRSVDPVNSQDEIEFLEKRLEVSEQKRLTAESIVREGSTRSRSLAVAAERSLEELKRKRQVDEAKLETLMTEFRSSGATPSPRSPPQSSPCPQSYNEDDVLGTPILLDEHTILSPEMNSLHLKLQQAVAIADRDGSPTAVESVNKIQRDIQRKMQLERAVERGHSPTVAVRMTNLEELLRERGDQVERLLSENRDLKESLASASHAAAEAAVRVVVAAPDEHGNLEVSELREVISQKDIIIGSLHQEIARIESSLAEYERNVISSKQDLRDIAVEREGLESQVRLLKKQSRRGEVDIGTGKGRYPDLEREKELKRQLELKDQEVQLLLDRSPRRENALRQQLEEKQAIIEALTHESPRVKHTRLQKTVEEQSDQIEEMKNIIERLRYKTSPSSSPRESVNSLKARIQDQQHTITSLKRTESSTDYLTKQLDDQDSTIKSLKQRIESLQKNNSLHKDLQKRFDAQQGSISELKSTIATLRQNNKTTSKKGAEVNKLKSQLEDQTITIKGLEKTLKQKSHTEETLAKATEDHTEIQQELRLLKSENNDLQQQLTDCEKTVQRLKEQLNTTRETDGEQSDIIDRLETDIAKLQTQLRQSPSQSTYDNLKREYSELKQEHNNLLEDVEQLTEQMGVLQATVMNDQTERDGIDHRTREIEEFLRTETANKLRLKREYLEMQDKLNGIIQPDSPNDEYNNCLSRLSKLETELVTALKYLQLSDVFDERLIDRIITTIEELTNENPTQMDVREVIKKVLREAITDQHSSFSDGQNNAELRRLQALLDSLASEYDELHPKSALSNQKPIVDRVRYHLDTLYSDLTGGRSPDRARIQDILAQEIQKRRMADAKVHQLQQQLSRGKGKLNREHQLEEEIKLLKNANEELRLDNNDLRYKLSSDIRDKQVLDYKQKVQDNKAARIKRENKVLRTRVRHVEDENEDLSRVVGENLRVHSRASSRQASPMMSHQSRSPRPTPLSSPLRSSRVSPYDIHETWTLDDN